MSNSKRERFVRVAEERTQKVLDDLKSLAKCAAPVSYEYTKKDVDKILNAIEAQLQEVRDRFAGVKQFTLLDSPSNSNPAAIGPVFLVERDYKGEFERFALTMTEFRKSFGEQTEPEEGAIEDSGSFTVRPLVHIWYQRTEIGSPMWNTFFSDMSWGLSESDIESGNLAYIREDYMPSLKAFLPGPQKEKLPLDAQIQAASGRISEAVRADGKTVYVDREKLSALIEDEMIYEFDSAEECLKDFFSEFPNVDAMKKYVYKYGFELDGNWYHIAYHDALKVYSEKAPQTVLSR